MGALVVCLHRLAGVAPGEAAHSRGDGVGSEAIGVEMMRTKWLFAAIPGPFSLTWPETVLPYRVHIEAKNLWNNP
jgi:hypothetical protein